MSETKGWSVRLTKHRATWSYWTGNPQGGGFGSNYCGPMKHAKARAIANIPDGETYQLEINGRKTTETK